MNNIMGKIIAIANQKGGVGKTTTAVHLGAALQMSEKKVLLVDFDPQGDTSAYMGFDDEDGRTISQVLEDFVRGGNADIREVIRTSEQNDNISYIPSDISLAGAEMYLISVMSRETVLKRLLEEIRNDYDYIIIDCQPSLGVLVLNALVAADGVVIPAQTQEFSKKALKAITDIVGQVQHSINPELKFLGILPTMADNTAMTKDTRQEYDNSFGQLIFPMNISKSVTAAYSSRDKKALCFKANSKIGSEYRMFAAEVERRIGNDQV